MKLYTTSQLFEMGLLPYELKGHILENCPHCKAPIVMNEKLTYRRCGHPRCIEHMSYKADRLFKHLGLKGFGPKTGASLIKLHRCRNHFELIPLIFKDVKPKVYLYEIALMSGIDGMGSNIERELTGFNSFNEYMMKAKLINPLIRNNLPFLQEAEQYFDIKLSFTSKIIEVMISGNLQGYTKNEFINLCNQISGKYFVTRQVGLKNSATMLITENPNTSTDKGKLARGQLRPGVSMPIHSSKEYLGFISKIVNELEGNLGNND